MPLFTVCVVIHTQTDSITVFDPEGSSPCACIDVSCVGESCMNSTKERMDLVQRQRYQKIAKSAIWWLNLHVYGQTAFWECFVYLHHILNQPQIVIPFLNKIVLSVIPQGNECAKERTVCTEFWLQQWTTGLHTMWEISEWLEQLIPS